MWRDLRYGLRQWRSRKLLVVTIVLLLSVGVGANTLIFSFVNTLLLKRLPVRDPEGLFLLEKTRRKQVRADPDFFYRQFEAVQGAGKVFSSAIAEQEWSDLSFRRLASGDGVRLVTTQVVSPNYFSELGVRAVAGRVLTERDATEQGDIAVVLSYQFWHSQFGGRRDAIGQRIRVNEYPFVVVGVLPEEFHSLDVERAPDIRFPIAAAARLTGGSVEHPRGDQPILFRILVRLAPGVSARQAEAEALPSLQSMEAGLWRECWPENSIPGPQEHLEDYVKYAADYRLDLMSAARGISRLREQFSEAVLLLMGGVVILQVGICANVAGLLLAKAQARRQEMALRLAMGAGRSRVLRQVLVENLLLAIPCAVLGIAFSYGAAPWLVRLLPAPRGLVQYAAMPQIVRVEPDGRVLLFALALAFLSVVVFGVAPAWRASGWDVAAALRVGGRNATAVETGLLVTGFEAALAVVLLTGSVAMLRTFWMLEHLNPGFDRGHVVEFTIDPEGSGYSERQAAGFRRELREKIQGLPGVRAVSYAAMGLMRGLGHKTTVVPEGKSLPEWTFMNTSANTVGPDYFSTLGIPLLGGRNLDAQDEKRKPERVVVNRAFCKTFFPRERDVVGKRLVQGVDGTKPPLALIVGIVGTAKYRSLREADPPIFYNVSDDGTAGMFLYVRTSGAPAGVVGQVRKLMRGMDARVPLIEAFTLEEEVQNSLWQERLVTLLAGFFGVVAVTVSALGLYASLAYSVARRSREMGIRIAIGAQMRDIVRAVCTRVGWSVGAGLLIGVLGSVAVLRLARALLVAGGSGGAVSIWLAVGMVLLVSVVAAVGPVRRAAEMDPAIALRE